MAFKDLREFMSALEQRGWLKRIRATVDPVLEITAIVDEVSKKNGPALLFEKPKGSEIPLAINLFGSYERMCLALGIEKLDDVAVQLEKLLRFQPPQSLMGKLHALLELRELASVNPKIVNSGPCKEVVMERPSLSKFPILKCWPMDAGRFITLPLVFTKDPESGKRNVGMYRMQVYDDTTTAMHWQIHKHGAHHYRTYEGRGERMEVAVALGGDPATIYSGTAPLPDDMDEMMFAGFLRKEPVEMVRCETIDVEVPAQAEIVLEGYVDPKEKRIEGPFGDHTGYYSLPEEYPVFHITCITHREDPIYPTIVVGRPWLEDAYLGEATVRIFLPAIRMILPEIVDINLPPEGIFNNLAIVSIKKSYPGQARKVIHALWGLGQMMFTKVIVVVDENVDIHNIPEVLFHMLNNIDPRRDVFFVEGPVDTLNHASPQPNFGSKMGIDATRKRREEGHPRDWPEEQVIPKEVRDRVKMKWAEYGLAPTS